MRNATNQCGQENACLISVVIPTLNEEGSISKTLRSACQGRKVEIIVVDAGSADDTVVQAKSHDARILHDRPPRSRQMNTGAKAARGGILLFLHADTVLPARFDELVRDALKQPDVAAGAFELRIEPRIPGLTFIERVANLRAKKMAMPYGDQAVFLKIEVFYEIGGFKDIPIMEDFELMRRLRKMGRILIVPRPVQTSARRWEQLGVLRTTVINQLMVMGYYLGVPPMTLAKWYRTNRSIHDHNNNHIDGRGQRRLTKNMVSWDK